MTPRQSPVRVAVVGGAGSWGRYYTRAYVAHPGCEVVALVDRARDRGQAFADHYGIAAVYGSVDELLQREVPDIVSAVLPVAHIHDAVIACAEAGVRVISCEKPIDYQLARADETLRVCRERGALLGCGTALYMLPYLPQTAAWIRAGNIGELTTVTIPGGLPTEAAGGGCHVLAMMRCLVGRDAEWAEGWTLPPEPGYPSPEAADETEVDRPAWGRIGLSGDLVCELPAPQQERRLDCAIGIGGTHGHVWVTGERPILVQGTGAAAMPVRPGFFDEPPPQHWIEPVVDRLVRAVDTGQLECTGDDYRQALEIAIGLTRSGLRDHERVPLPSPDRSRKLYPSPYRLHGGDVTGWEGNSSVPRLE